MHIDNHQDCFSETDQTLLTWSKLWVATKPDVSLLKELEDCVEKHLVVCCLSSLQELTGRHCVNSTHPSDKPRSTLTVDTVKVKVHLDFKIA